MGTGAQDTAEVVLHMLLAHSILNFPPLQLFIGTAGQLGVLQGFPNRQLSLSHADFKNKTIYWNRLTFPYPFFEVWGDISEYIWSLVLREHGKFHSGVQWIELPQQIPSVNQCHARNCLSPGTRTVRCVKIMLLILVHWWLN